ncbi:MAG: metallophosphoesterase [Acidobacteria bacterium]|nr:metallophosphoesterase [Acidobacteriota bacterium]
MTTRTSLPPKRGLWKGGLAVLLLATLFSAVLPAAAQQRIVAVGDVHGDFDALLGILRAAGVVDENLQWTGGKTILVQTGDILDRGPRSRSVMDLLMMLEKQAPKSGGRVLALLGNHEVMNMMGDLRYVSPQEYAAFADAKSEQRRRTAYQEYLEWRKRHMGATPPGPEFEQEWMQSHPLGYVEHRKAFAPEGKYGRWLREHDAVARVGDIVFLHGGIHPKLANVSVEEINKRIREEIRGFDADHAQLLVQKLAHPTFNLYQTSAAAKAELDRRKAAIAAREAEAAAKGKTYQPPLEDQRYIKWLESFLSYASGYAVHPDGPLWFRGFADWPDAEGEPKIKAVMEQMGVAHAVVGHTPQRDGSIRSRFGGKVFLIDTGMLATYYKGGQAAALEVRSGTFTAIYRDRRAVLLEPAGGTAPARSALVAPDAAGGALAGEYQSQAATAGATQAQAPAGPAARVWIGPGGEPLPFRSDEEVMDFLRSAKVVSMKDVGEGITNPQKVLLEKDGIRMNAVFRAVNVEKTQAKMAGGGTELFFRDSYIFEPAAYHLSKLLGMTSVPPVVERSLRGTDGSLQIWLEGVMTFGKMRKQSLEPPDRPRWSQQIHMMRFFDALVFNSDRNMGNMLIDRNWNLWLIDHTRAFRLQETPRAGETLIQCDRKLYEELKALDERQARQTLKPFLRGYEIDSLLKRRKKLIEHFDRLIREKGESMVLFDWSGGP